MLNLNFYNTAKLSIICAILAATCFSVNDLSIKYLSDKYPLHEIILFRSLIGFCLTLFIIVPLEGGIKVLKTKRPLIHLSRGLFLVLANMLFFTGLAILPLAECSAIFFISPLLITFLSVIILKEKVGMRRWSALMIGFTGVLIVIKPGQISFQWATLLPVSAAFCYAMLHISTRYLGLSEKASTLSFYIQVSFILVSSLMGLAAGDGSFSIFENPSAKFLLGAWQLPSFEDWKIIFIIGIFSSIGGYLISQAYRISEAGLIAPFEYFSLILAVLWGIMFFNEWLSISSAIGVILIISSGVYVAYREIKIGSPISAKKSSGRR